MNIFDIMGPIMVGPMPQPMGRGPLIAFTSSDGVNPPCGKVPGQARDT